MYVCMYIIYTYIYTHVHIYIYMYVCLYMYICMYVCIYVCMYVCVCIYIQEQNNGGPFTNHKYLLMPDTHPPHEVLTKIISAGRCEFIRILRLCAERSATLGT